MAKAVIDEVVIAPDADRGMVPVFDLSTMHTLIPSGEGVDLAGALATLLSESGSITPRTIKGECAVNVGLLSSELESIIDHQKPMIDARMRDLDARRSELLAQYRRVEAEKDSYEAAKVGDDISQARTKSEIMGKVGESRELGKELDILVEDYRALVEMMQSFEPTGSDLGGERKESDDAVSSASGDKGKAVDSSAAGGGYKAPIMLKTYQQDAGLPGSEVNTEVTRFALVAENLRGMEGQSLIADILHPLEVVLMREALNQLRTSANPTCGVVCDIFVRVDNRISTAEDDSGTMPETHCVAFWKEKDTLHLIDPSNSSFSSPLINEIMLIWGSDKVIQSIDGVLYGNGKKPVGRDDGTARDCIDIAVKIVLEMSYQTEVNREKKVGSRLAGTFAQLSTENQFAKHFSKGSDRQLRELTATDVNIRHMALKIARAIAGV